MTRATPTDDSQGITARTTCPSCTAENCVKTSNAQTKAMLPASQASSFFAFDGSSAAITLPIKGRARSRISDINDRGLVDYKQPLIIRNVAISCCNLCLIDPNQGDSHSLQPQ